MNIEPIGMIKSCCKEKFGIPRQPGLVPEASATLKLLKPYDHIEIVRGLETFSHVWLLFGFHATAKQGWQTLVRPPRLGGNERIGVFASRSMFRPNSLGLSVCQLESISATNDSVVLNLSGIDLLDKTPVFDIKPYLAYADVVLDACGGYANGKPIVEHEVVFNELAQQQCQEAQQRLAVDVMMLIRQVLEQDPRPAFHREKEGGREYGMKLYDLDVKWRYEASEREDSLKVVKVLSLW